MNRKERHKALIQMEAELRRQSSLSDGERLTLNPEAFDGDGGLTQGGYNQLKEQSRFSLPKAAFVIHIPKMAEEPFEKDLRAFAAKEIIALRKEAHMITRLAALLIAIGTLIIGVSFQFENARVIQEICTVASWVFCWVAIEKYCFERVALKRRIIQLLQIVSAQMIFE